MSLVLSGADVGHLAVAALALLVLEIRHIKVLNILDGRRWSGRFSDDDAPPRGGSPGGPVPPGGSVLPTGGVLPSEGVPPSGGVSPHGSGSSGDL
jgi:hypothetical protein